MSTSDDALAASQRPPRRSSALLLLALALPAGPAAAHPEFNPTRSNRFVKLSLVGGAIRIAYTVMIGEVPAAAARRAADRSADGVVDAAEARAWADALAAGVARGLALDLDGRRAAPAWDPPAIGGLEGPVQPAAFSVDLVGRVPAAPGKHLVRYDDVTPLDDIGDTEIRLEESPGTRIAAAWRGAEDAGRQTTFLFSGPKFSAIEDRSIGFRFADGEPLRRRRRAPLPIALIGMLLGAIVSVVLVRRQRTRRRATGG
jgi:hypothetical protein